VPSPPPTTFSVQSHSSNLSFELPALRTCRDRPNHSPVTPCASPRALVVFDRFVDREVNGLPVISPSDVRIRRRAVPRTRAVKGRLAGKQREDHFKGGWCQPGAKRRRRKTLSQPECSSCTSCPGPPETQTGPPTLPTLLVPQKTTPHEHSK